jgi:Ca2+-binding RTX toxin-like protein
MLINGTNSDDNLTGGDENDVIFAHGGNDYLFGHSGNDTLDGGAGADHMTGGSGDDHYYVDNRGDVVIEEGGIRGGKDTLWTWISFTLPDNVEVLRLHMNAGAINGQGNSLDNEIYGNDSNNHLWGHGGDDDMIGGGGADTMYGGTGDDYYTVENTGDVCIEYAGEGYDYVASSVGYTLGANLEYLKLFEGAAVDAGGNDLDNVLVGNSNDNLITGGGGHDWLTGGLGADLMLGGTGDDTYDVDNDGDIVFESLGQGTDKVETSVSFTLGANVERLVLKNGGGAINGTGNDLDNHIWGNDSFNVIDGGGGGDVIDGGAGKDTMYGSAGADCFRFDALSDAPAGGYLNTDYIPDFNEAEGDYLDFWAIDADTTAGGDQAFVFIGNGVNFSGTAGELRFNTTYGFVEGDVNGDAAADFQIELDMASLSSAAFVL